MPSCHSKPSGGFASVGQRGHRGDRFTLEVEIFVSSFRPASEHFSVQQYTGMIASAQSTSVVDRTPEGLVSVTWVECPTYDILHCTRLSLRTYVWLTT